MIEYAKIFKLVPFEDYDPPTAMNVKVGDDKFRIEVSEKRYKLDTIDDLPYGNLHEILLNKSRQIDLYDKDDRILAAYPVIVCNNLPYSNRHGLSKVYRIEGHDCYRTQDGRVFAAPLDYFILFDEFVFKDGHCHVIKDDFNLERISNFDNMRILQKLQAHARAYDIEYIYEKALKQIRR